MKTTSLQLQSIITRLAQQYGVDLSGELAFFWLERPDCVYRLIVEQIDEWRVNVSRGFSDPETGYFVLDPDILFLTLFPDWVPIAVTCSATTWNVFGQAMKESSGGEDKETQAEEWIGFVEAFAKELLDEGWLEHSKRLPDPSWWVIEEGMVVPCPRMIGCQSTNHDQCYGELWECAACGKTVCCAEGTDDHRELCDDCWASKFHVQPAASSEEET